MRLIAKEDLAAKLSLSVEWVEQAIPKGLVPSPIELDGHIRWSEEVIDKWIRDGCPDVKQQRKHLESDMSYDSTKTLADVEKETILGALRFTKDNREKAAQLLGIGLRTLYRKIKEYKLECLKERISVKCRIKPHAFSSQGSRHVCHNKLIVSFTFKPNRIGKLILVKIYKCRQLLHNLWCNAQKLCQIQHI